MLDRAGLPVLPAALDTQQLGVLERPPAVAGSPAVVQLCPPGDILPPILFSAGADAGLANIENTRYVNQAAHEVAAKLGQIHYDPAWIGQLEVDLANGSSVGGAVYTPASMLDAGIDGAMHSAYPSEELYIPSAAAVVDLNHPLAQDACAAPAVEVARPPAQDHQGPAIFQGFNPPPSYAWPPPGVRPASERTDEKAAAEAAAAAAAAAAGQSSPLNCEPPRPKPLDRPPPARVEQEDACLKEALASAMDQLRRCQSSSVMLRQERRGIPEADVEAWCATVGAQFQAVTERLEAKLEAHAKRSRQKDQTIKLLYARLQAVEQRSFSLAEQQPEQSSVGDLAPLAETGSGMMEEKQLALTWHSPSQRARRAPEQPQQQPQQFQKCMPRPVAERKDANAQQTILRREVANHRRRDVDIASQLRARDAQVDQLTATLRELQLVTQRQVGLYKRQLHLKDNSLQALQEELMFETRSQQASAASHVSSAPTVAAPSDAFGRSRRHVQQVSSASAGYPCQASGAPPPSGPPPRISRAAGGGATPRPGETSETRGRAQPAWPTSQLTKKDPRDRSVGALTHSPRTKHRDLTGRAEAPAARRRTSPNGPALGRSGSADERLATERRRRQEAEAALAAKVLRHRDGAAAHRLRR